MKTLYNKILFGLICTILIGCQPSIRFDEPQPKDKKNLKLIPKNYRGEYLQLPDSTSLYIKKNFIYWETDLSVHGLKTELFEDFDTIYEEDTEIDFGRYTKMYIDIKGDSAFVKIYGIDTIFFVSEDQVLRRHKGYLFLNYKRGANSWKVDLLKLENGYLDFQKLVSISEIGTLKEVININTVVDTSTNKVKRYELSPRKKEIKDILKRKIKGKKYKKL